MPFVMSRPAFTVTLLNVDVPLDAVTLPVMLPVTLPVTSPVRPDDDAKVVKDPAPGVVPPIVTPFKLPPVIVTELEVMLPVSPLVAVIAPAQTNVPATVVFPDAAATVNLLVATLKFPTTLRAPSKLTVPCTVRSMPLGISKPFSVNCKMGVPKTVAQYSPEPAQ